MNEKSIGTQPDQWEYVTSVAAAWDCPISIHSNLHAFATHPRTSDNLEVVRRWEEVRASHCLTEKQKKKLQNVHQEHHLLINEQNQFELVSYDQIEVSGGSREVRAFVFQRQKEHYVVYWHISGNKQLELSLNPSNVSFYEKLGQEENISSGANNTIVVPVSHRRYIKVNKKISKTQLIEAFKNARIIE